MNLGLLALIVLSVAISALAQIALKSGMSSMTVQKTLAGSPWETLCAALVSPAVVAGLALYGAGALLWLYVLARVEVSVAYPFVGLGFVLTAIFAIAILGEPINTLRLLGTGLVVAGVVLVGLSN
jgi:multidrug transporter EmrE-like cation transporter